MAVASFGVVEAATSTGVTGLDVSQPVTTETATWMSRDKGADRITISTYLEDFATAKSHTL